MKRTLLILAPLLLAGCAQPQPASELPAPVAPATPSTAIQDLGSFPFLVSGHRIYSDGEPKGGAFEVPNGTTFLLMEAEWTCPTAACGMRLVLISPESRFYALHGDTGKERMIRDLPLEGGWTAQMWPAEAVVQARGEIKITGIQGPIPPGHTAFG